MFSFVKRFFILSSLTFINISNAFEGASAFSSAKASAFSTAEASAFSSAEASAEIYYNNNQYRAEPAKPSNTPNSNPSTNPEDNFNKGNLEFTSNFFYNVVTQNPGKSVTLSPYSTLFLLAELALFATGESLEQLLSALNFVNQNEIKTVIPTVLASISEQNNITLNLAEKVYGNIKNSFSYSFKMVTKDIFRAEAENIDFNDPQKAADIINNWVANNTNNKIKDLIPASDLSPGTDLVLVDALYFFGEWLYKFNADNTSPRIFYASENKTVLIDTMNQVKFFKYADSENLNAQAIELPYINGNLTFLILLPIDKNGATSLVTKLLDPTAFTSVKNSLQSIRVDLSLPKFNTTNTIDLKYIFQKLNITDIFDPNSSGLSGILAEPQNLYVSAGIQKVNIEINESGSEASAGNAIIGVCAAVIPEPPIIFNADHPFIYYLLFKGTPIFCGLFSGN